MKKKQDFVTNSSSTSFIIGADNKEVSLSVKMTIDIDLSEFVEDTASTLEALDYLIEGYGDRTFNEERANKAREIIKKGGVIHMLRASDEDYDPVARMLCHKGIKDAQLPDNLVLIYGEGGY